MHRLSANLNFFFYLVLIIVLVSCAGYINIIRLELNGIKKGGDLWDVPIFILFGCGILYLIKKSRKVYFDSDNLYIKKRGK